MALTPEEQHQFNCMPECEAGEVWDRSAPGDVKTFLEARFAAMTQRQKNALPYHVRQALGYMGKIPGSPR